MQNIQCQCVDGNHTCGRAVYRRTGDVEHLRPLLENVQITHSVEGNVLLEQENISTEFTDSGAYANYPYVCTPVIPDALEINADVAELLESTVTAVVKTCDDCIECNRRLAPNAILEDSNVFTVINVEISNVGAASYTKALRAIEKPEEQSPPVPKNVCVKKSTSPQRPTDINTGHRTFYHQFSSSEQDGVLKCMEYAPLDNLAPTQRPKLTINPTEDGSEDHASATGSSSDSRSQSTGSYVASDDTLTGSSGVVKEVTARESLPRSPLMEPKVNTVNLEGIDALDTVSTLSTSISTENVGIYERIRRESASSGDTDSQQATNRLENAVTAESSDIKVLLERDE